MMRPHPSSIVCLLLKYALRIPSCVANFILPDPAIIDCGIDILISASGDLGTGLGPYSDVPLGTYNMIYEVDDNCGNKGICESQIEIRDCKKPTPFCKDGLIVEMDADSILVVNAEVFDDGSFDNCPGELIFSFSIDPSDTTMIFDCSTLGFFNIEVWLTDASGNQDFCLTNIIIQDNEGVCAGLPLISGSVETSEGTPIPNVSIHLNNILNQAQTDSSGLLSNRGFVWRRHFSSCK